MRRSTLVVVLITSVVGFGLFQLKYEVMKLESEHKKIHRSIKNSKEAISVLNAEWTHLVSPERLQLLAQKHLGIEPVSGKQLISLKQMHEESRIDDDTTHQNRAVLDQLVSNVLSE